ncbi:MAG: hypothetical protein CME65_15650 [Halobacteriovoraceae bacterium]|nr:hypothetical protein [Halobacteriovoraceae bacterium]|tara:strand:+ start:4015 stop:4218 length:204 start_codon:yes stop_codon:yes gene_type:complete
MKLVFLLTIILTSCANVKQIDRGRLASKIMQPSTNAEEKLFLNEVRSFREASVGGTVGAVGGGCGCN